MTRNTFFNKSAAFFLVVGTAIGAGMVTLPILLQQLSGSSIILLFSLSLWIMNTTADFFIELATETNTQENLISFINRYEPRLYWPTKVIYLLFFWSLLGVYLSALPNFIHELLSYHTLLSYSWVHGGLLILFLQIPSKNQAMINKILVLIMLIVLSWIMIIGATQSKHPMIALWPLRTQLSLLSPIMMFFGYHLTIPSLTRYVPDKKKLERVCLLAGLFIMGIYLLWSFLMLNLIADLDVGEKNFIQLIAQLVSNDRLAQVAVVFSMLAMATSCMGMSLGTRDFFNDAWPKIKNHPLLSSLITVAPSLGLIYGTQGNFIVILKIASNFALYLLVILPSWLVFKKRETKKSYPLFICSLGVILAILT